MGEFSDCFGDLCDPRAGNARHDLVELMFVALAAVLCGAEDCTDMAMFARAKLGFLRQVVKLEAGPPSHDTFSRVFRLLEPEPFEAAFARFTAAFSGSLQGVVAVDGKALRGAYERGRKATPLHLVNIWAAEARLVIGQRLAPGRNEALGAQQALALLRLDGCIVTANALHCRADTARIILDAGADYALALKANQPLLLAKAQALMIQADDASARASSGPEAGHDRLERRSATVVPARDIDFPGLAAVACVTTQRIVAGAPEPVATRWFLLSCPMSAEKVLDVDLNEDAGRSRKDNAPQNIALIRKIALNTLRLNPDKGSIKGKIKRAAWDDAFLIKLISHMR